MRGILKVLAIYTIILSLYSIATNYMAVGQAITITSRLAIITLVTMVPVVIFAALVLFYIRK